MGTSTNQLRPSTTSFGGDLTLHDLETLAPIRTFGVSRGDIQAVLGSTDGEIVVVRGGDRAVTLDDVRPACDSARPSPSPTSAFDSSPSPRMARAWR